MECYLPSGVVIANLKTCRRSIPQIVSAEAGKVRREDSWAGRSAEPITETDVAKDTAGTDFCFRVTWYVVARLDLVAVKAFPVVWRCYDSPCSPKNHQPNVE